MIYFIAEIYDVEQKAEYEDYIWLVKPVVEQYGGRYLLRSSRIIPLTPKWNPDRLVIIEWESRQQMDNCFASDAYRAIAGLRERSVDSRAIVVEVES